MIAIPFVYFWVMFVALAYAMYRSFEFNDNSDVWFWAVIVGLVPAVAGGVVLAAVCT